MRLQGFITKRLCRFDGIRIVHNVLREIQPFLAETTVGDETRPMKGSNRIEQWFLRDSCSSAVELKGLNVLRYKLGKKFPRLTPFWKKNIAYPDQSLRLARHFLTRSLLAI